MKIENIEKVQKKNQKLLKDMKITFTDFLVQFQIVQGQRDEIGFDLAERTLVAIYWRLQAKFNRFATDKQSIAEILAQGFVCHWPSFNVIPIQLKKKK